MEMEEDQDGTVRFGMVGEGWRAEVYHAHKSLSLTLVDQAYLMMAMPSLQLSPRLVGGMPQAQGNEGGHMHRKGNKSQTAM